MKYTVEITSTAQKQFKKLPPFVQDQFITKILNLENNPRPAGIKKLQVLEGYRLRVGDYRLIYSIDDSVHLVKVLDLGHRKDIYH